MFDEFYNKGYEFLKDCAYDDAEKCFSAALRLVHNKNKLEEEMKAILALGSIYTQRKSYLQAAALYNYALNICFKSIKSKENQNNKEIFLEKISFIKQKLINLENLFISSIGKRPEENSSPYEKVNEYHKNKLGSLRNEVIRELNEIKQQYNDDKIYGECSDINLNLQLEKAERIKNLYFDIAEKTKNFIRNLIGECKQLLGNPPNNCQYAIIGLGSLARQEMTPYSDIEFAILISQDDTEGQNKQYFRNMTNLLHLKIINLGETILPAMAIKSLNNFYGKNPHKDDWFYDEITPRGLAFDGAMPQACKTPSGKRNPNNNIIYELIGTPSELAMYQGMTKSSEEAEYWGKVEPHLPETLLTATLIDGEEKLLNQFEVMNWKTINSLGENFNKELAKKLLLNVISKFDLGLGDQGNEGKMYIVKKEIYRLCSMLLQELAIYYTLDFNEKNIVNYKSTWFRLEKLKQNLIISDAAKNNLVIASSIAAELRLHAYLENGGQNESASVFENILSDNSIRNIFHIKTQKIIFRFYYSVLPFYEAIEKFCVANNPEKVLLGNIFFDDSNLSRGLISKRLMQYKDAQEYFEKIDGILANDVKSMTHLGMVYAALGLYKKAEEILTIIYEKCVVNMSSNLDKFDKQNYVTALNNFGTIAVRLDKYEIASRCFSKAQELEIELCGKNTPSPRLANIIINLGNIRYVNCDLINAATEYRKALNIFYALYGINALHPRIVGTLNNLSNCLSDQNQALIYCQKALEQAHKVFGYIQHPVIADILRNMGMKLCQLSKFNEALEIENEALNMYITVYGEDAKHDGIAGSLNNLGTIYMFMQENNIIAIKDLVTKAIKCHEKALLIYKEVYGALHTRVAATFTKLGIAYHANNQLSIAKERFLSALNIYSKLEVWKAPNSDVAATYGNLGRVNQALGNLEEAKDAFSAALTIYQELNVQNNYQSSIVELRKHLAGIEKVSNIIMLTTKLPCITLGFVVGLLLSLKMAKHFISRSSITTGFTLFGLYAGNKLYKSFIKNVPGFSDSENYDKISLKK